MKSPIVRTTALLAAFSAFLAVDSWATCDLPGLQRITVSAGGQQPTCALSTSGSATISLGGRTRFTFDQLNIGPGEAIQTLSVTSSGHRATFHTTGSGGMMINGPLLSDGPLALFGRQVLVGSNGSIVAPSILASALLPANETDLDRVDSGAAVQVRVEPLNEGETGSPFHGQVVNTGSIRATGGIRLLGAKIFNAPDPEATATPGGGRIISDNGSVSLTAAQAATVSTGHPQATQASTEPHTISNYGLISGFSVEMRALPPTNPLCGDNCDGQFTLIYNGGKIRGLAVTQGVKFDLSAPEGSSPQSIVENQLPNGLIVTPDYQPLLVSESVYVKSGQLQTTAAQLQPNEGDTPAFVPQAPKPATSGTTPSVVPLVAPIGSTYSHLNTAPKSLRSSQPTGNSPLLATRGVTTRGTEDQKKKKAQPSPAKKAQVRGSFFGVPIVGQTPAR